jgi:RecA-family ATPase
MIVGKFGSEKSTITLSMANAIAQGREWCGLSTKQSHVLYLDRENPVAITRERLRRMNIRDEGALKIWTPWHKEAISSITI